MRAGVGHLVEVPFRSQAGALEERRQKPLQDVYVHQFANGFGEQRVLHLGLPVVDLVRSQTLKPAHLRHRHNPTTLGHVVSAARAPCGCQAGACADHGAAPLEVGVGLPPCSALSKASRPSSGGGRRHGR